MNSRQALSSDDLLSGHSSIHSKIVQDAHQIALNSQAITWQPSALLRQIITLRGKLTLNRFQGEKWPFELINGRRVLPLSEDRAHEILISGDLESALEPEPKALQSGLRFARLIQWCRQRGLSVYTKTSLKFRTEWHHDYQYDAVLSFVSKGLWLGLSEDVVATLAAVSHTPSRSDHIMLGLLNGTREFVATKVQIAGHTTEIKQIPRSVIFSPDFAFSLEPTDPGGFADTDEFGRAISKLMQQRVDELLAKNAPLLGQLPDHTRLSLLARLEHFNQMDGFSSQVVLAVNHLRFDTRHMISLSLDGDPIDIPVQLTFPTTELMTQADHDELKKAATALYAKSLQRLKGWAGKFDLRQIERPYLIKLLNMKPNKMKSAFMPLKEKLHGVLAMSSLVASDPRFSRYHDLYPARNITRQWVAYLGPTNSGKTHSGMEEMASVKRAIYLSPLRLMALENQERLEDMGIPCSLITGEEQIIRPEATHYCCTVEEFARFKRQQWDVVIVDEVQMLTDSQRGWAWTDALVSAQTPRLIMTGPPMIEPSLRRLADICGDKIEVVQKKRLTPLSIAQAPEKMEHIKAGSIIVAFSRKTVLDIKRILETHGRTTAVVYGALSPVVRREQARKFRDGDAEIMIATDAIGMGLNLPAQAIYFYSDSKFDGNTVRTLSSQEVKQIGGRAGRYGLSESGIIGAFTPENLSTIRNRYKQTDREVDLRRFPVRPNYEHLSTISEVMGERSLLKVWLTFIRTVNYGESFIAVLPAELMEWIRQIDNGDIDMELRWLFACAPVHGGIEGYASQWLQEWLRCLHKGKPIVLPEYPPQSGLKGYEDAIHMIDAYLHLARALPEPFNQAERAEELRELFNDKTLKALSQASRQSVHKPSAKKKKR